MTGQTQVFFHHYRAMDTSALLARYRSGGLLPEAEAALLEVLGDRGYAVEALVGLGADEIAMPRVDEIVGAHPVSMKASRSLPIVWRCLRRKSVSLTLWATGQARLRETWVQVVRIAVLALCVLLANVAVLFGLGGFLIGNIFCDQGPLWRCFLNGLMALGVGVLCLLILMPVVLALTTRRGRYVWYLRVFPLIPLLIFLVSVHWHEVFPELFTKVATLSALMVLFSSGYAILQQRFLPPPLPQDASNKGDVAS